MWCAEKYAKKIKDMSCEKLKEYKNIKQQEIRRNLNDEKKQEIIYQTSRLDH